MRNAEHQRRESAVSSALHAAMAIGDGRFRRAPSLNKNAVPEPVVFIIDPDSSVRQNLQSLLSSVNLDSLAFGSVADFHPDECLSARPSCLVLDVRLPGLSGLAFQEQLTCSGVRIPIIFLTGHADVQMSVRAMKSGAVDFLTKPFREQDLLDAISAALARDRTMLLELEVLAGLRHRFSRLTERERVVMSLVVAGRMNKQIAAELELSQPTVKVHRGRVMRKLNARTVPDLVRMADALAQGVGTRVMGISARSTVLLSSPVL
jgi:FixJ family two-component response regulator